MTIASLVVRLSADAAQFHKNMEAAARRTERVGRTISKVGREISQAISLPLIAAGFAAFHTLLADSARHFGPLFQAFDQLKASVRGLFLALGRELQPVFLEIIGLLQSGIATLRGWIDAFHKLPEGMRKAAIYTLAFLAALGPTVFAIGKVVTALGAIIKIAPLLLSSTGLIVGGLLAIAGAAVYAATHTDRVKELMLEDLGAIVQGFFLAARATVLGIDIMTLGITKLIGVTDTLRAKLNVLEDKTLGKLGGLIFEANEKLKGLTDSFTGLGGVGQSVQDIMKTMNDTLAANELRTAILGPRYNFLAENAAAYGQAVDALTAKHLPLNTVLNAQGMTLADLGEKFQFISERAAEYARVIATMGPTSKEAMDTFKHFQEVLTTGKGFEVAVAQLERYAEMVKAVNASLVQAATDALVALGQKIGGIIAGISHGFRGLGGALKGILGSMLIDIGKAMIAAGIAAKIIKAFLKTNPAVTIAAGLALIAVGSALTASAQSAVNGGDTGSNGSYSASASGGSGSSDQGPTTLILRLETPDGLVDSVFRDPRNQVALARLLEELGDRQVIIDKRSSD